MRNLYTIGHSNHDAADFLALLKRHGVEVVVDVRSAPYSRYVPQFNKAELEKNLKAAGFTYLFLGDALGGKPRNPRLMELALEERYKRIAESAAFQKGLDRLQKGLADGWKIVLMCAEEDPLHCHRHLLVARELELERHIPVIHLRADGSSSRALDTLVDKPLQMRLFDRIERT